MVTGLVLRGGTAHLLGLSGPLQTVLQQDGGDGDVFLVVAALIVGSFLFGAYLVVNAVVRYRKERLVENTPLAKARSVAMGRTNIEGTATPVDEPLARPCTDGECLDARWEVKQVSTRTEDTTTYSTVAEGSYGQRFYLEDETGQILVEDPADADVMIADEYETEIDVSGGSSPPDPIPAVCADQEVHDADDDRKYEPAILPPDTELLVFGAASRLEDAGAYDSVHDVVVGRDPMTGRFMLTDESEDEFVTSTRRRATEVLVGLVLMAVPLYLVLQFFSLLL